MRARARSDTVALLTQHTSARLPTVSHDRVHTSAAAVKLSATKLAYVYQSQGCDSWVLQRVGEVRPLPGATRLN